MREIKFRAWNKDYGVLDWGLLIRSADLTDIDKSNEGNGLVFMQYTGLKDKNGTEIYEGDIVKETYPAGYSLHEVCFGEYDNGLDYEDNTSGYGVYTKEHRYWPEYELDIGDYSDIKGVVIGNIYENPELLNGQS